MREIRNIVVRGDLYVLETPRGIKIGRSEDIPRRMKEVSRRYFGGAALRLVAKYEAMGYLEPFVHIILNAFRILQWREEFTCDLQAVQMAFDHVKAYDIFGKLNELPPDIRLAARQEIIGAASTAISSSSSSADGGTGGRTSRSRGQVRSRSRGTASSSALAEPLASTEYKIKRSYKLYYLV